MNGCVPVNNRRHPFCFLLDTLIVVIVNILVYSFGELLKSFVVLLVTVEHLCLHSAKERFHDTVINAVSLTAHGLNDPMFLK